MAAVQLYLVQRSQVPYCLLKTADRQELNLEADTMGFEEVRNKTKHGQEKSILKIWIYSGVSINYNVPQHQECKDSLTGNKNS